MLALKLTTFDYFARVCDAQALRVEILKEALVITGSLGQKLVARRIRVGIEVSAQKNWNASVALLHLRQAI